jgi:hypothetical protein
MTQYIRRVLITTIKKIEALEKFIEMAKKRNQNAFEQINQMQICEQKLIMLRNDLKDFMKNNQGQLS